MSQQNTRPIRPGNISPIFYCAMLVSDEEQEAVNPQPKRRRILDPSAIISVPVYTNQVSNGLQLKPTAASFTQKQISDDGADDGADDSLWFQFSPPISRTTAVSYIDSEEDETEVLLKKTQPAIFSSPSPPGSPEVLQSRHAKNMINKIDKKLRAANTECRRRHFIEEDDDIICINPNPGPQNSPYSESLREIPLKIRCMTHVHKIPVLSSTPLSDVLTRLSVILDAPPPRLMLLRKEEELPANSTVGELGLGIADIIECVSKDRDSSQEFSLHRDAPLGSIFSQYMSKMSAPAKSKVRFHFDGCKVTDRQTPAHLDMEDGDIIEVWT
ncbi:hypothetical protein JOQ06_010059 [Pogonophryne albipinna]|uniref:NFATC2-interacting protein n=1 Tax=Pogonophryne albipinna TaxID=1090488 RepID=A0AAD6FF68_9TELE|nr:hypothetical protein JOQ06_010059 [Pogonophryne albipinna]